MASTQGTPSTAGKPPRPANNKAGFCWQDVPGVALTDGIFDQYAELGVSKGESAPGRSSGFGQLGQLDFSELSLMSSHVTLGQLTPSDGGVQRGSQAQRRPSALKRDREVAGPTYSLGISQPSQHVHPLYRGQTDITLLHSIGDIPEGSSILDSGLLNLEGLTMRSPRVQIPHLSTSEPASPPAGVADPHKGSRLGKFCTKVHKIATTLQEINSETSSEPPSIPSLNFAVPTAQPEPAAALPGQPQRLWSPFSSALPEVTQRVNGGSESSLINRHFGYSFNPSEQLNDKFAHPLRLEDDTMHHRMPLSTSLTMNSLRLPISTPDEKPLWATTLGIDIDIGVGGDANSWWDPSSNTMETDTPTVSYHAAGDELSTSLNMGAQIHHRQRFEHLTTPGTTGTSTVSTSTSFSSNDLMLHMPQPCRIPSAVLQNDISARLSTNADHHHLPGPRASSLSARHQHNHHRYGRGVSPRKGRPAGEGGSSSSSRIVSVSASPRPSTVDPSANGNLSHRRSASVQTLPYLGSVTGVPSADGGTAIRKRRSWTGQRTSSSPSLWNHHQHHGLAATAAVAAIAGGNDSPSVSSPRKGKRTNTGTGSRATSISSTPFVLSGFHSHTNSLDDLPDLELTDTANAASTSKTRTAGDAQPRFLHRHKTEDSVRNKEKKKKNKKNKDKKDKENDKSEKEGGKDHESEKAAAVDDDSFVNYTPQDHVLLMAGVAPSGSSKTKARREREAAERQRALRDRLARLIALHRAHAHAHAHAAVARAAAVDAGGRTTTRKQKEKNEDMVDFLSLEEEEEEEEEEECHDGLDGVGGGRGSCRDAWDPGSDPDLGACLSLDLGLDLDMDPGTGLAGLWNGDDDGTEAGGLALSRNEHENRQNRGGEAAVRDMAGSAGETMKSNDEEGEEALGVDM